MTIEAILTDIEGTTSSIAFVHEVLFPYAAHMLPYYVRLHARETEVAGILDEVRATANEAGAVTERVIEIMLQWIDEDRKLTPLKALQGMIWEHGYTSGDFTGHMYADAVRRLSAWHQAGLRLYVYSSGSVQAQQLLFGHSDFGDLRELFSGYFDTRIGAKREVASYLAIAEQIGLAADQILFLSDVVEELDAAVMADMHTMQLVREPGIATGSHAVARNFEEIIV
jgi:enolase-phosphatase E1